MKHILQVLLEHFVILSPLHSGQIDFCGEILFQIYFFQPNLWYLLLLKCVIKSKENAMVIIWNLFALGSCFKKAPHKICLVQDSSFQNEQIFSDFHCFVYKWLFRKKRFHTFGNWQPSLYSREVEGTTLSLQITYKSR